MRGNQGEGVWNLLGEVGGNGCGLVPVRVWHQGQELLDGFSDLRKGVWHLTVVVERPFEIERQVIR